MKLKAEFNGTKEQLNFEIHRANQAEQHTHLLVPSLLISSIKFSSVKGRVLMRHTAASVIAGKPYILTTLHILNF